MRNWIDNSDEKFISYTTTSNDYTIITRKLRSNESGIITIQRRPRDFSQSYIVNGDVFSSIESINTMVSKIARTHKPIANTTQATCPPRNTKVSHDLRTTQG